MKAPKAFPRWRLRRRAPGGVHEGRGLTPALRAPRGVHEGRGLTLAPGAVSLGDEGLAQGQGDRLRTRIRLQLAHRLLDVRADRLRRKEQLLADLLVGESVREKSQDLAFALGQ